MVKRVVLHPILLWSFVVFSLLELSLFIFYTPDHIPSAMLAMFSILLLPVAAMLLLQEKFGRENVSNKVYFLWILWILIATLVFMSIYQVDIFSIRLGY
jgi:hypothetical protein